MSKRHITARVDEIVMKNVDHALKKYPGLNVSQLIEMCIASFFNKDLFEREKFISYYLLNGLKKPKSKGDE